MPNKKAPVNWALLKHALRKSWKSNLEGLVVLIFTSIFYLFATLVVGDSPSSSRHLLIVLCVIIFLSIWLIMRIPLMAFKCYRASLSDTKTEGLE